MAIKYDENYVKQPLAPVEYTPEMLKELKRCSEDIQHFLRYVKIVHPDKGRIDFEPYDFQRKILQTVKDNRFSVILCSRQAGKSTVIATYALWFAIFHPDVSIGIVSNKALSAIDILARIKLTYEELPSYLKPGVSEYSKTFVTFDNKAKIMVSSTSADAFRGRTLNLLVADEFAFVRKNIAEDFWSANYPTISTSTEAKIIIISTPNGMFNLFHRIYTEAEHMENTFIPLKFTWRDVPGRDKAWADEQLRNLGKVKFAQEQLVEFLGSTNTVIDPNVLEILLSGIQEPEKIDLNGRLMIYEKPHDGATYVLGTDTAKGTGENSSVIQALKIESLIPLKFSQVATYISNAIDVYSFADVVNRISYFYNNAFIMCENNAEGSAVVNRIWWDHENPNLVNTGSKTTDLGIRANKLTKPKAVLLMKKLIEDGDLTLIDRETIKQLASFIDDNGRFKGNNNMNDDCVSALYWAVYIVEMGILDGYHINAMEEKSQIEGGDDIWGILSDSTGEEDNFDWLFSKNF